MSNQYRYFILLRSTVISWRIMHGARMIRHIRDVIHTRRRA